MSIVLLYQDYDCKDELRRGEYDLCIQKNLDNPFVSRAIDFAEKGFENKVSTISPKHELVTIDNRLTFAEAVRQSNKLAPPDSLIVLVNLDIFLASGWHTVASFVPSKSNEVMCLGRHEYVAENQPFAVDPALRKLAHAHSQDCWVWRSPLHIEDAEFCLGTVGCDNAIAHRMSASGRICRNPMFDLVVVHVDSSALGNPYRSKEGRSTEDKPETRGCLLVPARDKDGSYFEAIMRIVEQLGPESQSSLAVNMYNSMLKISN